MPSFRRDTFRFSDFTLNEGTTADEAPLIEGEYQTVYYKLFEAGEAWSLGRGLDEAPDKAQGRIFMEFADAGGNAITEGKVRFDVQTRQGDHVREIGTFDLEEVNLGEGDRGERRAFPVQELTEDGERVYIGEGRRLAVRVRPDVGTGVTEVDDTDADTSASIEGKAYSEGR